MFSICSLTSGSAGNSLYIKNTKASVLIDCGLSGIEIERRLNALSLNCAIEKINGIIITHEHSDHCSSAGILARRYSIPVYIREQTLSKIFDKLTNCEIKIIEKYFNIENLEFETFSVTHDAVDPIGLIVKFCEKKIGIVTDIGFATQLVIDKLSGVDGLIIESNYDDKLLMQSDRPLNVKQRIKSRFGHLSNNDAVKLVDCIDKTNLKFIGLFHISSEHNNYELAYNTMKKYLEEKKMEYVQITACRQDIPLLLANLEN